jgi:hypothetical protein
MTIPTPSSFVLPTRGTSPKSHIEPFLDGSLGIAPAYSESDSRLVVLAIENQSTAFLVEFYSSKLKGAKGVRPINHRGRILLQGKLFCRTQHDIFAFAFDFEGIALSLHHDHGLRLVNGIDIQSTCSRSGGVNSHDFGSREVRWQSVNNCVAREQGSRQGETCLMRRVQEATSCREAKRTSPTSDYIDG